MQIPALLYGTAWKGADTQRLVALALQQGFRGIDTACQPKHYDEAGVGAGIVVACQRGMTRRELYLQTKFTSLAGQDPQRIPYDPKAPLAQQVRQSVEVSQRNLQTDYLDCLILHAPLPTLEETLAAWRVFESLVDSGAVRELGVSNCVSLAQLEALFGSARIKPAVVQNRFYAASGYDREIRSFCDRQQIVYQSFWTLTANRDVLTHGLVTALAATYQRTPAQILFRYLTQAGVVPLIGTRSVTHMRADLAIFDFELAQAERRALDELFAVSAAG